MKSIITLLLLSIAVTAIAQSQISDSDLEKYSDLLTSNYIHYDKSVKIFNAIDNGLYDFPTLSEAPEGYTPFYISHYGRHGSRYHYSSFDYDWWSNTFETALNEGYFNETGIKVCEDMLAICKNAKGRAGDLTAQGRAQHQGIAKRMFQNFPEVFNVAGATIDAKSTTVPRCIISMSSFCQELRAQLPSLTINTDAGECFQYFMNPHSKDKNPYNDSTEWKSSREAFYKSLNNSMECSKLFKEPEEAAKRFNMQRINSAIYDAASTLQGVDIEGVDALRTFLSHEGNVNAYMSSNFYWYSSNACVPQLGGTMNCKKITPLLEKFVEEAEAVISGTSTLRANLRFGHDSALLPLLCLMNVNKAGDELADFKTMYHSWSASRYIPMAGNIQIIFYRNNANPNSEILVKILQNESEASLPIGKGPYYKWNEVKAYWKQRITDCNR